MSAPRQNGVRNGSSLESNLRPAADERTNSERGLKSLAEKFEDEKKRINDSCFAKKDADGLFAESYITHVRVNEDAQYPSSPPPETSALDNKKPRIIVLAVKRTGRVRMHKARENQNGTFSIGKSWPLDELTAIESFTGLPSPTLDVEERREWQRRQALAKDVGFLVTISKPYYWQAASPKEKDFFIGSLIKVFKKYTNGRIPQLSGFTQAELLEYTATGPQRPRTPQTPAPRPSPTPTSSKQASSEYGVSQRTPNLESARDARPQGSVASSLRNNESQERIPNMPGQFPSSEFVRNLKPQDAKSRFQAVRSESPSSTSSLRNESPGPASFKDDQSSRSLGRETSTESFSSKQDSQPETASAPHLSVDRLRSNGTHSPLARADIPSHSTNRSPERKMPGALKVGTPPSTFLKQEELPERRRPPISIPKPTDRVSRADSPQEFLTPSESSPARLFDDRSKRQQPPGSDTEAQQQPNSTFSPEVLKISSSDEDRSKDLQGSLTNLTENPPVTHDESQSMASMVGGLKSPPVPMSPPDSPAPEEVHRPGLGPMIKKKSKKDIANDFRRAAAIHNAFKPRAGGGAAKIRDDALKSPNTPDGINGVFPAPSLVRDAGQEVLKSPLPLTTPAAIHADRPPSRSAVLDIPDVKITPSPSPGPLTPLPQTTETPQSEVLQTLSPSPEKNPGSNANAQEELRRKRQSNHAEKYAQALGIDPSLLEGRTIDIEATLSDFGWNDGEVFKKSFDDLHHDIRRELAKAETGSWLGSTDQNEEKVSAVLKLLDKTIAECEEMDGLLTLYSVELGTLSEDIAYIEAQSQGLQVQTANQRLLQNELQNLLQTIEISSSQLAVLKDPPLAKAKGIQAVETSLTLLYKAMLTIDPKLRQNSSRSGTSTRDTMRTENGVISDAVLNEVSHMHAVQEKKDIYQRDSIDFIYRLKQHLAAKFRDAETETKEAMERNRVGNLPSTSSKLDLKRRDKARAGLWIYSPLILFARDIDTFEWEELLRMYESTAKKPYQEEYRDNINAWKRMVKKSTGEEQDVLFTTQEKEADNIVARKLTVKRSKTIREGSSRSGDRPQDGKLNGFEVFAGVLFDISQSVYLEQNFLVDLFHINSLEAAEFSEVVAASAPETRKGSNIGERKLYDPDRNMAKRVQTVMEEIYSFWPADLQNLVDWVISQDCMQAVGILFALESKLSELEGTNQEFIMQTLNKIHTRLTARFDRFVDEQIKGIEETKVKIKKRKGVIAFMKTFPYFSSSIESMLPAPRADPYEIRHTVNTVYDKINNAMFESLKFIAKESPVIMAGPKSQGQIGGDTEDKEILNYHILLIENMNHYVEEVDVRGNPVLGEWKGRAVGEMKEHMDLYLATVIRRPLGKLLDFVESTESLLVNAPNGPTSIATRASHSRSTFKKVISTFDSKEIRRGIEALKKRVDKHFGDADDPGLSRNLVQKVLRECEERYTNAYDRTVRIVTEVYEGGLEVEWKKEDVLTTFRRGG